jgi:hypothetical protein
VVGAENLTPPFWKRLVLRKDATGGLEVQKFHPAEAAATERNKAMQTPYNGILDK